MGGSVKDTLWAQAGRPL